MAGKVRDTLPQALARCGYRNIALYPMLRIYLSIDRFFTAVGIPEMLDAKDQRAVLPNERDRFYFANALGALDRHLKASQQPMFMFIETMAAHGSYDLHLHAGGKRAGRRSRNAAAYARVSAAACDGADRSQCVPRRSRAEISGRAFPDRALRRPPADREPAAARLRQGCAGRRRDAERQGRGFHHLLCGRTACATRRRRCRRSTCSTCRISARSFSKPPACRCRTSIASASG